MNPVDPYHNHLNGNSGPHNQPTYNNTPTHHLSHHIQNQQQQQQYTTPNKTPPYINKVPNRNYPQQQQPHVPSYPTINYNNNPNQTTLPPPINISRTTSHLNNLNINNNNRLRDISALFDQKEIDYYLKTRAKYNIPEYSENFCMRYFNVPDPVQGVPKSLWSVLSSDKRGGVPRPYGSNWRSEPNEEVVNPGLMNSSNSSNGHYSSSGYVLNHNVAVGGNLVNNRSSGYSGLEAERNNNNNNNIVLNSYNNNETVEAASSHRDKRLSRDVDSNSNKKKKSKRLNSNEVKREDGDNEEGGTFSPAVGMSGSSYHNNNNNFHNNNNNSGVDIKPEFTSHQPTTADDDNINNDDDDDNNYYPPPPLEDSYYDDLHDDLKYKPDGSLINWAALQVPPSIWTQSLQLTNDEYFTDRTIKQVQRRRLVIFCSLIILLCRREGLARTFSEVTNISDTTKKDVGSVYKQLSHVVLEEGEHLTIDPTQLIQRWCQSLGLFNNFCDLVVQVHEQAVNLRLTETRCPTSACAASIWFSVQMYNGYVEKFLKKYPLRKGTVEVIPIVAGDVLKEGRVVQATLNGVLRLFNPHANELLSKDRLDFLMMSGEPVFRGSRVGLVDPKDENGDDDDDDDENNNDDGLDFESLSDISHITYQEDVDDGVEDFNANDDNAGVEGL